MWLTSHSAKYRRVFWLNAPTTKLYNNIMCISHREIIEDVRANGTSALERIQTSGNVAAYELALVLRLDPL